MSITLDSTIRAAADAKYGSYDIDLGDDGTLSTCSTRCACPRSAATS
jgi:hypothetical protein